MSKISLSTKIIACFSIILAVAVVSSVISIISARSSQLRIASVANVNVPLSTLTTQSMDELTSMVLAVRTYTATGAQSDYDAGQLYYKPLAESGGIDGDSITISDIDRFTYESVSSALG